MKDYSRYISSVRRSVPAPRDLVDGDGSCVFGTFQDEFETMDLVSAKKPTHAPQLMNRLKLTLWQATEVFLNEGILLSVVCDMGIFGKTLNVFYDKRAGYSHCWDTNLKSSDTVIAPNLLRGSVSEAHTPVSFVRYENSLDQGKIHLSGSHRDKDGWSISYDFELDRISRPSVVSIPFGLNRPLYSQKDFLKAAGTLTLNGEVFGTDDDALAVMDDHRGFYPRRCHYDWVTTMGYLELDGKREPFALNLTRNQSVNQDDYNENLIWLEGRTSLLPPVRFTRSVESADFRHGSIWTIRDDYDMVNLTFKVTDLSPMVMHALVVNIDYYIAYGVLNGYVRREDGTKYLIENMQAMGEDKTMLL